MRRPAVLAIAVLVVSVSVVLVVWRGGSQGDVANEHVGGQVVPLTEDEVAAVLAFPEDATEQFRTVSARETGVYTNWGDLGSRASQQTVTREHGIRICRAVLRNPHVRDEELWPLLGVDDVSVRLRAFELLACTNDPEYVDRLRGAAAEEKLPDTAREMQSELEKMKREIASEAAEEQDSGQ